MKPFVKLDRSVKGRGVIVTGAASGMGRATAHVFADEGAIVAVTDVNEAGVKMVVDEIRAKGGDAHGWALDVSNHDDIKRVVNEIAAKFGRIDILVNNAGISAHAKIDDPGFDAIWDRTLSILVTAQQRMVRAALPYLRKSDAARIVNVASSEAFGATAKLAAYTAGKTAVVGLTRSLAMDLGPEGITVNCICPGPIHTGMTEQFPDNDKIIYAKRRTALKRYGEPEEVAHMTLSLCLPAASFITGTTVLVDGGLTIRNG